MRRSITVLCFLLLAVASTSGVLAEEPRSGTGPDAARFRQLLGFDSSAAAVDAAAADPNSTREFGYFLSRAEAAELASRMDVARQLDELKAYLKELPEYGGLYIDHESGGAITVNLAGDTDVDAIRDLLPAGAELNLRSVRFSLAELEAVSERVKEAVAFGDLSPHVDGVGADIPGNFVEVSLRPDAAVSADALIERFGSTLKVVPSDGGSLLACTDWRNCAEDPWRGGLALKWSGDVFIPYCTSGFVAKNGSAKKMLVAGHCGDVNSTWRHDGVHFGTLNSPNRYVNGSDADAALINIVDDWASNQVVLGHPHLRSITSQQGVGGDEPGDVVCHGGARTKDQTDWYVCGVLFDVNEMKCFVPGICIDKLRGADVRAFGGDSGGPVLYGNQALGLIHGGSAPHSSGTYYTKMWYSHIFQVSDELAGWTVQTTP
jgi:hypothetical protein